MAQLFEPTTLKGMTLNNRFVRSATYEAMASIDGTVQDPLLECMAELARGQVGLVITGHAYVAREGKAGPRQLGIYADAMVNGLKRLTSVIHEHGGKVAVQLAHAGKKGIGKGEYAALGPVDVLDEDGTLQARAMTGEALRETILAFGDAAERAVKAGFDAVQIHSAHGYLLSQFLSPYFNTRKDAYGGSLNNRARLLLEVYEEVRQRVGSEFPVLVKINAEDFLEGGLTVAEMVQVSRMLEERGIDAIEMSGGTFDSGKLIPSRVGTSKSEEREVYYRSAAAAYKKEIQIPLILVGGFLSFSSAEEVVTSQLTDYVALSRPLIREPHLVQRWMQGDRRKASCISCNQCFATLSTEEALHCPVEKKEQAKRAAQ